MKTKIILLIATLGSTMPSIAVAQSGSLPKAKITAIVTDETGKPVERADVGASGTLEPKTGEAIKGLTSTDGMFAAELRSNGEIGITAKKGGYYETSGPDYNFRNAPRAIDRAFSTGQWEPWNATVAVTLKTIANPIPMYARRVNRGVPVQNEDLGFDMFVGDFVTPHGRGKTSDMIFRLEVTERTKKDYDYKLTVAFPNTADGILPFNPTPHLQGSALRSPYSAPEKGFLPSWTVTRSRRPGSAESSNYDPEKRGYFFRIRSSVDKSGKILSANYGKIYGDFMNFTYYLNPTPNDRNIEFDPKRNLFTNLKDDERVTAP